MNFSRKCQLQLNNCYWRGRISWKRQLFTCVQSLAVSTCRNKNIHPACIYSKSYPSMSFSYDATPSMAKKPIKFGGIQCTGRIICLSYVYLGGHFLSGCKTSLDVDDTMASLGGSVVNLSAISWHLLNSVFNCVYNENELDNAANSVQRKANHMSSWRHFASFQTAIWGFNLMYTAARDINILDGCHEKRYRL